jgi:tartrate dehydrogenase/decarboxylase/D-malate dehydrogenase
MNYKVPVIPGDGIGPEIIAEGKKVLEAAADKHGFSIDWTEYPLDAETLIREEKLVKSGEFYISKGPVIEEETLKELEKYRAIYLGAIGDPRVKPGVLEKGILLSMRFYLDQYVNLRPVKLLEGVWTPLKDKGPKEIDFVVVRENTEDFYIGIGSRAHRGISHADFEVKRSLYKIKFGLDVDTDSEEIGYQIGEVSKEGCRRVIKYAFDLAMKRGQKVSSVDKANVLSEIYGFWREVFLDVAAGYPQVKHDFNFVDAITMWFVKNPEWFDVIVAPNMFGDIITDLGAMIQGGLGLAPGANLNPEGTSMFEPIHGSAPKYRGQNKVNPIATIWAGAMLLEHLGEAAAAKDVVAAIERNLFEGGIKTYDMGGSSTTSEVGTEISRLVHLV